MWQCGQCQNKGAFLYYRYRYFTRGIDALYRHTLYRYIDPYWWIVTHLKSIPVWFSSATKSDLRRLRRVVRTAERIIGTTLPNLQELYSSRMSKRVGKITLDPSHPAHSLFELLPSGRRYRALNTRTTRHKNSFFPQAIHLMNTWHKTWNTQHYYTLLIHHTYLFLISNLHISDYLYTHNCLYYILCFYYFVHCLYVYYSLLSVSCPVALWSFCHYNKFLVCVNTPGNKAHFHIY